MATKLKIVYNLNSTSCDFNPMIPQPEDRPRCSHKGCNRPKAIISTLKDGSPNYRKVCHYHHQKKIADRYGVKGTIQVTAKKAGMTVSAYQDQQARKKGFKDYNEELNAKHPYRKYRKDYCENRDGHVTGHKCTTTIVWDGQLDVDHVDGNPSNNDPDNLQTLCKCCHAHKTSLCEDVKTPGRKALGVRY